jgi:ferredoxin-NADP reductase
MKIHKVVSIRAVSETAFVLRMSKEGLVFVPGLHISVGIIGEENRPYSIYSGIHQNYLEILVKEIPDGLVTPELSKLKPGDDINVGQPRGYFCLPEDITGEKICLIATGTGIAPFHSFIVSNPDLDYHLFHGVKDIQEAYDLENYKRNNVTVCTSKTTEGDFSGRVTQALKNVDLSAFSFFYLCGNYEMIDDVYDVLESGGISKDKIKTEGYF